MSWNGWEVLPLTMILVEVCAEASVWLQSGCLVAKKTRKDEDDAKFTAHGHDQVTHSLAREFLFLCTLALEEFVL